MMQNYSPMMAALISVSALLFLHCEDVSYTYDKTDPEIVDSPAVSSLTDSSATIHWITDEPCHVTIEYGTATGEYDSVYEDIENREIHTITLMGLSPYTDYYCIVRNWDFRDNGPVDSDEITFTTEHNEFSLIRVAWEEFTAGNTATGLDLLYQSYSINPYHPEILASIGWFRLLADSLDGAREAFSVAYYMDSHYNLTLAGMAVLSMIDNLPENAINYAGEVVSAGGEWSYTNNHSINYLQMHLILAEAYMQTDQLPLSQSHIDIAWPENGLDTDVPATWIVQGTTYSTYEAALIAAINYAYNNLDILNEG